MMQIEYNKSLHQENQQFKEQDSKTEVKKETTPVINKREYSNKSIKTSLFSRLSSMAKPKSPKKAKVNPFENDVVEKLKEKYKTKFEESSVPESKA